LRGISDRDLTVYINVYDQNLSEGFKATSEVLLTIGGLSLFISWLFFNAGSAKTVNPSAINDVGRSI